MNKHLDMANTELKIAEFALKKARIHAKKAENTVLILELDGIAAKIKVVRGFYIKRRPDE